MPFFTTFIYTFKDGWKLYDFTDNLKDALEDIEKAPDQTTNYMIYSDMNMPTTLYPTITRNKFDIHEHVRTVAGKKSILCKGHQHQYAINIIGNVWLFSDNLFDES